MMGLWIAAAIGAAFGLGLWMGYWSVCKALARFAVRHPLDFLAWAQRCVDGAKR